MSASNVVPFRPAPPQPELHLKWLETAELTPQSNRRRNPEADAYAKTEDAGSFAWGIIYGVMLTAGIVAVAVKWGLL